MDFPEPAIPRIRSAGGLVVWEEGVGVVDEDGSETSCVEVGRFDNDGSVGAWSSASIFTALTRIHVVRIYIFV